MSDPVSLLLGRLSKVKPAGKNAWRAVCPACGGKNGQKLSVRVGDTGAVLVKCWGGCDIDAIAAAAGLSLTDLFPPSDSQGKPQRGAFRYEALKELRGELVTAWILLAQIGRGHEITERDRKSAARLSHRCSTLLQELG